MKCRSLLFVLLILSYASLCKNSETYAQEGDKLIFPLDCKLDENCWAVKYVDVDDSKNSIKDFMCGPVTTDDHKGVDFAIRSRGEMRQGVDVYAAMDGTVSRVRDGESDSVKTETEFQAIKEARKECGNAVLIDHKAQEKSKLSSLYCHLKVGSITVEPGEEVKTGQKIAEVGQSGLADFPHLHFGVVKDGNIIDPYTSKITAKGCSTYRRPLWKDNLSYDPIIIFHGGFRNGRPDFTAIKEGQSNPPYLSATGEALVYWTGFYQLAKGDTIDMSVTDENGREFVTRHIFIQENASGPVFYYTGRDLAGHTLPPGIYTGKTIYTRKGLPPETIEHTIEVK